MTARKLVCTKSVLWKKCETRTIYKIGKSKFFKILRKLELFKKSCKRTDVCDICKGGKQLKKEINEVLNFIYSCEEAVEEIRISMDMEESDLDSVVSMINDCMCIDSEWN